MFELDMSCNASLESQPVIEGLQTDGHDSDGASISLLSNDKSVDFNSSGTGSIDSEVSHEQSQDLQRRASTGWWNIRREVPPSMSFSSSVNTTVGTRVAADSCSDVHVGHLRDSNAFITARDLCDSARSLATWPPVRTSRLALLPSAARSPTIHYADVCDGQSTSLDNAQRQAQIIRNPGHAFDAKSNRSRATGKRWTPPGRSDMLVHSIPPSPIPNLKITDPACGESLFSLTSNDLEALASNGESRLDPLTRFGYREYSACSERVPMVPEVLYGSRLSGYGKSNHSSTTDRREFSLSLQQDSYASASQDLLRTMSAAPPVGHGIVDFPPIQRPATRRNVTKDMRLRSCAGTIMNEHTQLKVLRRVMLFFTFGFLFPPLWVFGGMLPLISSSRPDLEKTDESKFFYQAWLYKQACRMCVVMFLFVMLIAVPVVYKFWWTW